MIAPHYLSRKTGQEFDAVDPGCKRCLRQDFFPSQMFHMGPGSIAPINRARKTLISRWRINRVDTARNPGVFHRPGCTNLLVPSRAKLQNGLRANISLPTHKVKSLAHNWPLKVSCFTLAQKSQIIQTPKTLHWQNQHCQLTNKWIYINSFIA